jgi:hypothetical protein
MLEIVDTMLELYACHYFSYILYTHVRTPYYFELVTYRFCTETYLRRGRIALIVDLFKSSLFPSPGKTSHVCA